MAAEMAVQLVAPMVVPMAAAMVVQLAAPMVPVREHHQQPDPSPWYQSVSVLMAAAMVVQLAAPMAAPMAAAMVLLLDYYP